MLKLIIVKIYIPDIFLQSFLMYCRVPHSSDWGTKSYASILADWLKKSDPQVNYKSLVATSL